MYWVQESRVSGDSDESCLSGAVRKCITGEDLRGNGRRRIEDSEPRLFF